MEWILLILWHLVSAAISGAFSMLVMLIVSGIIQLITKHSPLPHFEVRHNIEELKEEIAKTEDEAVEQHVQSLLEYLWDERLRARWWMFLFWLIVTILTYCLVFVEPIRSLVAERLW